MACIKFKWTYSDKKINKYIKPNYFSSKVVFETQPEFPSLSIRTTECVQSWGSSELVEELYKRVVFMYLMSNWLAALFFTVKTQDSRTMRGCNQLVPISHTLVQHHTVWLTLCPPGVSCPNVCLFLHLFSCLFYTVDTHSHSTKSTQCS